jgi:hypothetical protein
MHEGFDNLVLVSLLKVIMVTQDHGQTVEKTNCHISPPQTGRVGRFLKGVGSDLLTDKSSKLLYLRNGVPEDSVIAQLRRQMDKGKTVNLPVAAVKKAQDRL